MNYLQFSLGLTILFLVSCTPDDDHEAPKPIDVLVDVNMSDLSSGQHSYYLGYTGSCFTPSQTELTGDTLILSVSQENGSLQINERLTQGSPNYDTFSFTSYPVEKRFGYVLLPERSTSSLFYFYANDTIWTSKSSEYDVTQSNCFLEDSSGQLFEGNAITHVDAFDFGPGRVEDKLAISCEPFFELDAYLLYDQENIHLSHVIDYNSFDGPLIQGWSLLDR